MISLTKIQLTIICNYIQNKLLVKKSENRLKSKTSDEISLRPIKLHSFQIKKGFFNRFYK